MPNYSLIVDSTYNPLTYAEISAPVKEAAAFHQALQDKYDEQAMNAAIYDRYIGDDNPEARAMYDEYMASLNSAADALMKHGAWGQRDIFSNVRKGFAQKMLPIKMAYEMGDKEAQQQLADLRQNPLLVFDRDATKSNIDYYLKNPKGGYRTVNPAHTASYISTKSKAFAERIKSDPEFRASLEKMGENTGYLLGVIDNGLNPETALEWRKDPILRGIMKEALSATAQGMQMDMNGYGIDAGGWTADQVNRVIDFGSQGFVAGVGKTQAQFLQDLGQMHEWDLDKIRAQQAAAAAAAGAAGNEPYDDYYINYQALDDQLTDKGPINDIANEAKRYLGQMSSRGRHDKNPSYNYNEKEYKFTWDGPQGDHGGGLDYFTKDGKALSRKEFYSRTNIRDVAGANRNDNALTFQPTSLSAPGRAIAYESGRKAGDREWNEYTAFMAKYGFTYDPKKDGFYKDGKEATYKAVRDAVNEDITNHVARYHYLADTGLTYGQLNPAAQNLRAHSFEKYNKDGSYNVKEDNPVPLASIEGIDKGQILVDAVPGNKEGMVIRIPTGDSKNRYRHYYVSGEELSSNYALNSTYKAYQDAVQARRTRMRERGLSESEWNMQKLARDEDINYYEGMVAASYRALLRVLGGSNTVGASSV